MRLDTYTAAFHALMIAFAVVAFAWFIIEVSRKENRTTFSLSRMLAALGTWLIFTSLSFYLYFPTMEGISFKVIYVMFFAGIVIAGVGFICIALKCLNWLRDKPKTQA